MAVYYLYRAMGVVMKKFAEEMFAYNIALSAFEDKLTYADTGLSDYDKLGADEYDMSLEIYGVPDDDRLSHDGVEMILGEGFDKIYVNHTDGWETHYSTRNKTGWRRKRTSEGFLISHWPEGWGDPETGRNAGWLVSGYMKIIPDPLLSTVDISE